MILNPKNFVGWQHIFESGLITRESCFDCHYTNLNRVSDYTIGDFWDAKGLRPDLKSNEGTSILLVNTEKGENILNSIRNNVNLWPVTEDEYMQPRLNSRTVMPSEYTVFWKYYFENGFTKAYSIFLPKKTFRGMVRNIKNRLLNIYKTRIVNK